MKKKNIEALAADHGTTDFEVKNEENVGDIEIGNDTVVPAPLHTNEPPSKGSENAQGASSP
ncbi:hypothetical protein A2U01_0050531, partial [Trifolium medium]|nr:hypothetical protein [Trifolium medium]